MRTRNYSARAVLASCTCLGLAGCTASAVHGDQTTYTLAPWVVWSLVAGGALLAAAGLLVAIRAKSAWAKAGGVVLLLLGPTVLGLGAWKATLEYVTVADDHVEYGAGSVLNPTKRMVYFDDCLRLEFRVKEVAGDRGRPEESVTPFLVLKSGEEDIGRVMFRGPVLDDLTARLKKRGIPVVGDRRGL